jgi:hypothetical protein
MHCQQGGEGWACSGLLNAFRRFSGGFKSFLGSVVNRPDRLRAPVWPVRVLALFTCCAPVLPVVWTGLTGQSWVVAPALSHVVFCKHLSRGSCIGSGGALCGFFELWFGGLRSLLEHSFVSDVSSLRGPRLVFFRWSAKAWPVWPVLVIGLTGVSLSMGFASGELLVPCVFGLCCS